MKNSIQIFTIITASFLTIAIFVSSYSGDKNKKQRLSTYSADNRSIPQVVENIKMKKAYSFADEALPIDNFDVKERLERELLVNTYWHSSTLLNIKTSARYFPLFERILREEGVPDDFKYLAIAESNLKNVKSPAGARGIWQFMTASAKEYDMELSKDVDERYHVEKATRAACKMLKQNKKRFGSWMLAAAAYNVGSTRIAKELKNQRAKTYFDLNLNEETSRYLFRIIAIKEVLSNPQDFGFYLEKKDYYQPLDNYKIVTVNNTVNSLGDFAVNHGTTYRMLKVYNPWLRTGKLSNPKGKTYEIRVPR